VLHFLETKLKIMSLITYPQENNKLAVMHISPNVSLERAIQDVPSGKQYKIVETLEIDNNYFDAYDFDAEVGAVVNISKAKEVHLNKFRAARNPKLQKLDIDFMKAVEAGDTAKQAEIAAQKQSLRDVTSTPLPDTLEGIKNTWPEILN